MSVISDIIPFWQSLVNGCRRIAAEIAAAAGSKLSEILPPFTGRLVNSLIRRPIESRLKVSSYYLLNMDLVFIIDSIMRTERTEYMMKDLSFSNMSSTRNPR